jgi:hypothetical protein
MIGQRSMNQVIGQASMNQMIGQRSMNTVSCGVLEVQEDRVGQLFLEARMSYVKHGWPRLMCPVPNLMSGPEGSNLMSRSEGAI